MKEFEILTINTPVIMATMKNPGIALVKGMPEVYHKEFDITEFIGEKLAEIRNVRSRNIVSNRQLPQESSGPLKSIAY